MKKIGFILIVLFLFSCDSSEKAFLASMNAMDEGILSTAELRSRERELREAIRENRKILEQKITGARDLARAHQMLCRLYFDNAMYLLAAEEFEAALMINNESPILLYYAGLSYARFAKSLIDEAEQLRILLLAERYYLKAIEYNENFSRALYAVAILYVFELDRPGEAIFFLERFLETQKSDTDAMFVLANAYIQLGLFDQAIAQYDNIIRVSKSSAIREQADSNKRQLMDGGFRW